VVLEDLWGDCGAFPFDLATICYPPKEDRGLAGGGRGETWCAISILSMEGDQRQKMEGEAIEPSFQSVCERHEVEQPEKPVNL
jgi:hypothetical protein